MLTDAVVFGDYFASAMKLSGLEPADISLSGLPPKLVVKIKGWGWGTGAMS